MKTFVPASASADSTYLLFHLLSQTEDEIITRIYFSEAAPQEIERKRLACEWLSKNIRPLNYGIAEYEVTEGYDISGNSYKMVLATSGYLANKFKCDRIAFGYNTHNWSMTNWFYRADENENGTESFYDRKSIFNDVSLNMSRQTHFIMRDVTDLEIIWPFMWNKKNKDSALGRWQIYEALPNELKAMISLGCHDKKYRNLETNETCGTCWNCLSYKWYRYYKSIGWSASQMDEHVMKLGEYGKYWHPKSSPETRSRAYDELRPTLLVLES